MGYDHYRIKSNAKLFYKNNMGTSILSVLIQLGMSLGMTFCMYMLFFTLDALLLIILGLAASGIGSAGSETAAAIAGFFVIVVMAAAMILPTMAFIPFSMGYVNWYRRSIYEKVSLGAMFDFYGNGRLWSCIGTGLLRGLYVMLWSLLFYIPGVIKSYSYSQTFYIKAENPNISPSRAIELSTVMMDGHKGQLFYLHLSFIGWFILSGITWNILGILYVIPYYSAALAFTYEEVKADAVARGVIDIREINPNIDMREIYPEM